MSSNPTTSEAFWALPVTNDVADLFTPIVVGQILAAEDIDHRVWRAGRRKNTSEWFRYMEQQP